MTLALTLPPAGVALPDLAEYVRKMADIGYTAAWGSEVNGPDFASLLGHLAGHVDVDLGVIVVPAQIRAPWLLAATAASLSQLSGGRFSLGVGTSSEVIIEQWSGLPFDKPLSRLRETVELLRELLSGERVDHEGEFHTSRGYRLGVPPAAPVPLIVGALNAKSLRQAGEIGDGVALNQLGVQHLPQVLGEVRKGAEEAGKRLEELEIVARLFAWVTDDPGAARDQVRRQFAPYAATRVYNRFFRWLGYDEEMDALDAAAGDRDRAAMAAALSDDLVDALYIIGDADHVGATMKGYVDGGVTVPVIAPLGPEDADHTLRTVAEALA